MTERTQEGFKKINGELIPVWDGKAEKFEDYRIRSRFYVRSGDAWKASQKIGNLIQALGPDVWGVIQSFRSGAGQTVYRPGCVFQLLKGELHASSHS